MVQVACFCGEVWEGDLGDACPNCGSVVAPGMQDTVEAIRELPETSDGIPAGRRRRDTP